MVGFIIRNLTRCTVTWTSNLFWWVSRTFGKIIVGLMALGVENEIKKPAPGWTCNQPDKGVYYLYHNRAAGRYRVSSGFLTVFSPNPKHAGVSAHNCNVSAPSVTWAYMWKRKECVSVLINRYFTWFWTLNIVKAYSQSGNCRWNRVLELRAVAQWYWLSDAVFAAINRHEPTTTCDTCTRAQPLHFL